MKTLPTIQIAIAEDHACLRDSFASFIQASGRFNVCIRADNGKDLLDKLDKAIWQPDICIIDINMPVMDGYETMRQLKIKYPLIKGLAFTMYDEGYPLLQMAINGASGFISKSVKAEDVVAALTRIYTHGFYFSDAVLKKYPKITSGNLKEYAKLMLSSKQCEFLSYCCSDLSYEEIGNLMHVSKRTAEKYAAVLCAKLDVHSRIELALYAQAVGIHKKLAGKELSRQQECRL